MEIGLGKNGGKACPDVNLSNEKNGAGGCESITGA